MSTQPLLSENTTETEDTGCLSLQIGEFQGLLCPHLPNPGMEEFGLFKQPQSLLSITTPVDTMHRHNIPLFHELRQEFSEIFASFTPVMKAKDAQLYRHSLRVQSLALSFATTVLHLPEAEALTIGLAAFFHDIGKLKISEKILLKASGLTRQEFEIIKGHPGYGANMLSQFKLIQNVLPSVYHHHERLDGRGYPDGIRGAAIPLGARVIAIVDAFEVMTSHRIYQQSRTAQQAFEELYDHAGTQFDAELVELFCKSFEKLLLSPRNNMIS
jgi:putative nucleotidyltransferase with HDIG domain